MVDTIAPVLTDLGFIPDGQISLNGQAFRVFQIDAGNFSSRERVEVKVATHAVYITLIDHVHDRKTAFVEKVETSVATLMNYRYQCFHFQRAAITD